MWDSGVYLWKRGAAFPFSLGAAALLGSSDLTALIWAFSAVSLFCFSHWNAGFVTASVAINVCNGNLHSSCVHSLWIEHFVPHLSEEIHLTWRNLEGNGTGNGTGLDPVFPSLLRGHMVLCIDALRSTKPHLWLWPPLSWNTGSSIVGKATPKHFHTSYFCLWAWATGTAISDSLASYSQDSQKGWWLLLLRTTL